jgi:enoyl-[acyl-carrier protein] reductase II
MASEQKLGSRQIEFGALGLESMMICTRMTELLGIKYPIMMGAMAWITKSKLVAAVCNAGATGVLGAGGRSADWVRDEIRETKKLTGKAFGINISLETTPWRDSLVQAVIDEGIPFVTLGAGDPRPFVGRFRAAGIKVVCIVPNAKLARRVQDLGADLIVIEGMESGGRIGNLTTMALMTNVIPEVTAPVVAAGGIVDGRGMAAAITMGASGVQMGSRFLLAEECEMYPDNKQAIIDAQDTDSTTTGWSRGVGMRGLRDAFTEKYLQMETAGVPVETLNQFATGASRKVAEQGVGADGMNGMVQVGQSLGPLKRIQPAAEIIEEVMAQAEAALLSGARLVSGKEIQSRHLRHETV